MTSAIESAPRAPQGPSFGAALLDLDGCLIDSNDAHARAWSAALARFGRSVPVARLRSATREGMEAPAPRR
ncbi:MAG: hypothetical protein M3542_04750 [Acidobacteriota bacterium]|nr:hypothetical protein [Acidobacteriota bacterium]